MMVNPELSVQGYSDEQAQKGGARREQFRAKSDSHVSERLFRLMWESSIDGMRLTDRNGIILAVNQAYCRLVGMSAEELEFRPFTAPVAASHNHQQMLQQYRQCFDSGTLDALLERTLTFRSGRTVEVEVARSFVELGQEDPLLLCVFRDITERKRAEQAKLAAEARFRSLVEQSLTGIYIVQGDCFTYVNPQLCQISGYSEAELTSRPVADFVVDEDRELVSGNIRRRLSGEIRSLRYTLRMKHRAGHVVHVEVHGVTTDFAGHPSILGTMLDITERKLADKKIREQASLLDKARDAICVGDMESRITYWNASAERLYGWTAGEASGRNAVELLCHGGSPVVHEAQQQLRDKGEWFGELRQRTKAGREIIVESRWNLVLDDAGQPKSVLMVNTDISEKKKLEASFFRAQRLDSIGTLASGIAHDLNNVLAPILMAVQLMRMRPDSPPDAKLLDTIETGAQRGADMVKQVLSFARGVEGERTEIQMKHLVAEMVKIVKDTFPRGIQIISRVPADTWTVMGDATQLHQILLNLCVNARDAMPAGGKLEILVENLLLDESYTTRHVQAQPGPCVVLTIRDSGTGIPQEFIDKIFDPFFTTKAPGKGTGLGLSTVLGIVKSHGGFLNVYSEPNKGTQFKVYLPACTNETTRLAKKERPVVPKGNGELLLVVDDEIMIRETCKSMLEANGYRVVTAEDGTEALAVFALQRDEIHLVITDTAMPFMDGPATIRALERLKPGVKIIAASGRADSSRVSEANALGVLAFIQKPYTAEVLLAAVHNALKLG
jgi:PAS domain S-box-containing protein